MDQRISVADCRSLLGTKAESLTDEEILTVRDDLYELSNVIAEAYLDLQEKAGDLENNEAAVRYGALRVALGWDEFEKEDGDEEEEYGSEDEEYGAEEDESE